MHRVAILIAGVVFCSLLGTSGCTIIAAVADKVMADPKEPARYVPAKETLVVLVENYQNPAAVEVVADHIDRLIVEDLVTNKVAPVVNPDRLTILRTENGERYRKMKIPEIGRALGAQQVLYADITEFTVESAVGTEALKGLAEARVRIVDSATGQTRWPRDATSAGFPVTVVIPFSPDAHNGNETAVREALARALAARISRLFYAATISQLPGPAYPESD